MEGNREAAHAAGEDQARAQRERDAGRTLLGLGADELDRRPWRPEPIPPSAVDLAQFGLWKSSDLPPEGLLAALALVPAARDEVEGLESGLLFMARGAGFTWAQIAQAMGFKSPQACQQHFGRLTARQERGV